MAISSDLERLLSVWLPRQPWYSRSPADAAVDPDVIPMSVTRLFEIESEDRVVQGLQVIASVGNAKEQRTVNIPLVLHTAENFKLRPYLIGRVDDLLLGVCWVYDGAADPVFIQALAADLRAGRQWDDGQVRAHALGESSGADTAATDTAADAAPAGTSAGDGESASQASGTADDEGIPPIPAFAPPADPAQILRDAASVEIEFVGDQEERSTVVIHDPGNPAVLTVFRTLRTGMAQNVEVPLALTRAGSSAVRPVQGWLAGRWFDGETLQTMTAPLAMLRASERDAQPAWREAVDVACQVDSGLVGSYNRKANALGQRVGELHLDLAREFPTHDSAGDPTRELVSKWQNRVDWALARAPLALSKLAKPLRAHKKQLGALGSVGRLQRIHGDLTLNHVVSGRTTGFTVVDFPARREPEPRPVEVDLVALLRSIDYAAGYARLSRTGALSGEASPAAFGTKGLSVESSVVRGITDSPEFLWSGQAQNALLSGYGHAAGASYGLGDPVLRAVLIDRLLVEVVTELHNRPAWLVVPLVSLIKLVD